MTKENILTPILLVSEKEERISSEKYPQLIISNGKIFLNSFRQHLYLISKEGVKEGDWCLWLIQHEYKLVKAEYDNPLLHFKIARATDPLLIADGVPAIDGNTKAVIDGLYGHYSSGKVENIEVNFLEEYCNIYNERNKKVVDDSFNGNVKMQEHIKGYLKSKGYNQEDNQKKVDVEKLAKEQYPVNVIIVYGGTEDSNAERRSGFINGYNQALQSNVGGFSLEDVEWISNNQFTFDGQKWSSTKIHYMGSYYTTKELYNFIQSLTKEQPKGDLQFGSDKWKMLVDFYMFLVENDRLKQRISKFNNEDVDAFVKTIQPKEDIIIEYNNETKELIFK